MSSVLYDEPGPRARTRAFWAGMVGTVVLAALLGWVVWTLRRQGIFDDERWDVFAQWVTWEGLLRGLRATLKAAGVAAILALALAVVVAALRLSPRPWISRCAAVLIEFFRGMPVVLLVLFTLLVFSTNPFVAVVAGLTVYNGVVIAEVLRAGINSLPRGQREAGLAIGLTASATFRTIELPQAARRMLPALISQVVVLLKDTSLGYVVAYPELLRQIRTLTEFFGNRYLFSVFFIGSAMYIGVNLLISRVAVWTERRIDRTGRALRLSTGIQVPAGSQFDPE
jgi:glutamate transport system permease protein